MNNSLTRLYQSQGHSAVTAAVTPVQASDNALSGPSGGDSDHVEITSAPSSLNPSCKEPHVEGSQSIRNVTPCDLVFSTCRLYRVV